MGQVPVLFIDGLQLAQSVAICEYLEEIRPTGLLPAEPEKRAKVREVVETVNSGIQPLQNAPVVKMIGDMEAQRKWTTHFITKGLGALEKLAESNKSEDFFFGWSKTPTLADVFIVPQVFNAQRYGINMAAYPRVFRVFTHLMDHVEGFRSTMPPTAPRDIPSKM
jgi:maleylacetoacetate isomerase